MHTLGFPVLTFYQQPLSKVQGCLQVHKYQMSTLLFNVVM